MTNYTSFRDVHHISWDDVQSRRIGQEGIGAGLNILFHCPNPACGRKASVSVVKSCGRCFHCPWTFYVRHLPPGVLTTWWPQETTTDASASPQPVHLERQPLTDRTYAYLGARGLVPATIDAFAPVLFECHYRGHECLGWSTATHDVYELRELRLGSSFKSAVNGKDMTMLPLAEESTDIVLTEGLISAMSYAQLRQKFDSCYIILNSVTSFGKLARYEALLHAHRVILALDNDPDGRATMDLFRSVYPKEVTIDMPLTDGADWNDALCATLPLPAHAPLEQFVWEYDDVGRMRFDQSADAVARRKAYLERVDARLRVSYRDIEALVHQPGKKVVCWGASSGKTSAMRQFIVRHYGEYILYAARTIAEIERLAYDIGCFIGFDNVLALSAELDTYQEYANDPLLIQKVPVLLVTHERLCLDPPGLLCRIPSYHRQMQAESGRTYMLIDEHPQTFKRLTLSPEQQSLITQVCGGHFDTASAITFESLLDSQDPVAAHGAQIARQTLSNRTQDDMLSRYRAFHWIDIIAEHCRALTLEEQQVAFDYTKPREFTYYYRLSELDYNLTIFDGTGDLSLPGSPHWDVIKPKHLSYRFRGTITHVAQDTLTMLPRHPAEADQERSQEYRRWLTTTFVPFMTDLSRKHTTILFVTWKNFKGAIETLLDHVDVQSPYNTTRREMPKTQITLDQRLLIALRENGMTNVVATYYQSGKTRGTSEFADCDAVLFLGAFFIPHYALTEYNRLNTAQATKYSWTLAELIQGAYRSRIRQERPVDIYFSWDWPAAVVHAFATYLDLKTVYRSDFSLLPPAEQLRLFLEPDPRSERVFALLATQAQALLTSKSALYTLEPSVLTERRPDHVLRSVNRILDTKGVATWISRLLGMFMVQLYYRPTDFAITYTYEPEQRAAS